MIQIYTGDGKGKTTASLGLAIRALGAGKRVAIVQFLKKGDSSEFKAIKKYKLPIDVFAFGIGYFKILGDKHSKAEHQKAAQKGLLKAQELIKNKKYDLIILDEINIAIGFGLLNINEVISMLSKIPKKIELILTGRRAKLELKKLADLVTVMQKEKHYFDQKVQARRGIEY